MNRTSSSRARVNNTIWHARLGRQSGASSCLQLGSSMAQTQLSSPAAARELLNAPPELKILALRDSLRPEDAPCSPRAQQQKRDSGASGTDGGDDTRPAALEADLVHYKVRAAADGATTDVRGAGAVCQAALQLRRAGHQGALPRGADGRPAASRRSRRDRGAREGHSRSQGARQGAEGRGRGPAADAREPGARSGPAYVHSCSASRPLSSTAPAY